MIPLTPFNGAKRLSLRNLFARFGDYL